MQETSLGTAVPLDAGQPCKPRRGDFIFSPGHVAIALDESTVLHATAHPMLAVIEPLADLLERVKTETGNGFTAIRRL
jgi:hypothetical protein